MKKKIIRCAIYTRKSTEEGLEQEFNSLDAQREAGEAYIKSQKHEGWDAIPTMYDDGGFSGGNMERPALKKLLADIESGKIDIVVVYKVDSLSRALSDFAKMVEIFDANNVSFVSVTQSFNTTTSMGRLTLNVLLSFAQFEREVTGERIRDKFAASKKKGMWMGGLQPLGYDVVERKLIINKDESEIIRFIFKYYVNNPEGEPLWKLLDELKSRNYKNKSYISQKGNQIIGKEFSLTQIHNILNNQLYNGKIQHKKEVYAGEHTAIIDDELWNAVHSKITKKEFMRNPCKKSEQPKLVGKIFDYLGHRLSPTYSYKYSAAGRYKMRYYINREICKKGKTTSEFKRIRAEYIDNIVAAEMAAIIATLLIGISKSENNELSSAILKPLKIPNIEPIEILSKLVLFPQHMELTLKIDTAENELSESSIQEIKQLLKFYKADMPASQKYEISTSPEYELFIKLNIKASYKKSGGQMHIITENGAKLASGIEAQYCHSNDKTFIFIAKSFYWNKMIDSGIYKAPTEISRLENHSLKYVKRAITQRFLSPKIIARITSAESDLHCNNIGVESLSNLSHWCWAKQEKTLLK